MPSLCPLSTLSVSSPQDIGETANVLLNLQAEGHALPETWVIPASHFQQLRQTLIAREPLYADWPQLFWESESTTGYPVQHLAKRLQRPLLTAASGLPWKTLTVGLKTPVVRLLPSLWLGHDLPTALFAQMLPDVLCWAEPEALEAALKQLWGALVNAKSLAFWSHWAVQNVHHHRGPQDFAIAVLIQAVEPASFSGTLTRRANDDIEIAMVQGLPEAIAESCPDLYQGPLPDEPRFTWQPGYQESRYHPCQSSEKQASWQPCYITESLRHRAGEAVDLAIEQQLWSLAQTLLSTTAYPLKLVWSIASQTGTLHILQAYHWPLSPVATQSSRLPLSATGLAGKGASSGRGVGLALVLRPDDVLPPTAHRRIIIAREVQPEWLPVLKTAVGIISEKGGLTCHAAVLARELGVPAVVGVSNATERLQTGEPLRIDGDRGLIEFLETLPSPVAMSSSPTTKHHIHPAITAGGETTIWLNLSQPDVAQAFAELPVAGVGLLRSEWLMLPVIDRRHPYHWLAKGQLAVLRERLLKQLRTILKAFAPRPVRYRTLDIRSNEFAQLQGAPDVEANPMLGIRGTFSYRHHPEFYQFELQMLKQLQDEGYTNLQLLLPFVRTVEEVRFCQQAIRLAGLSHTPEFELWMMAEVPSVLFSLTDYVAAGIQGIAIGTHDLMQLLLGIDRDQALFSEHFNETHPAVQAAIAQLIQQAEYLQLPCCLCGASPMHHPSFVDAMVRTGLKHISVDASALEVTAQLIQQGSRGRSPQTDTV